jgi:hypothetical protein
LTPPAAQLIQGYKFKAYWFEVFECVRKIFMVGIPCFFPPGATAQLIFGLIISFVSGMMYAQVTRSSSGTHNSPHLLPEPKCPAHCSAQRTLAAHVLCLHL